MEGAHRKGVASSLVNSQLFIKVGEGVERVGVVKTFLVFSVASLDLAIVSGSIRTYQFVADVQKIESFFEFG